MSRTNSFCLLWLALALLSLTAPPPVAADKPPKPPKIDAGQKLDREQVMILNLNRGPKSTGFYITESMKQIRTIERDLDKARQQLEQVDKNYAKYKGRPDDRFLQTPEKQLQQAEQTAKQLHTQLDDAYEELKEAVKESLVSE